jgi:hypothetical protein
METCMTKPSAPRAIRLGVLTLAATLLAACAHQKVPEPVAQPKPAPAPKPVLMISDYRASGSSDAHISFINGTDKTLQYVMFKTTAFTRNGQRVNSKKSGRPNAWLRVAGPFAPGEHSGEKVWKQVWQNRDLGCFRIEGAELIYAEDQSVEYHGSDHFALLNGGKLRNGRCGGGDLTAERTVR